MRKIERFDKYMNINKLNDNQVTVNCGLSVGLLGKARRGDSDLGDKAIEKILSFYQDINRVWLLTGEGEMLKEGAGDGSGRGSRIRYWVDVDATAGGVELFDDMTTNRFIDLSIPGVPGLYGCREPVRRFDDAAVPERTDHHPQRVEREFYRFRQRLSGHHVQRQPDGQIPASGIGCRSRSLHLRK